jgi:hypothetical protein
MVLIPFFDGVFYCCLPLEKSSGHLGNPPVGGAPHLEQTGEPPIDGDF